MKKFFVVLIVGAMILSLYNKLFGLRDPQWNVKLSDSSAFSLSSVILARAKTRGCGDLEVTGQYPREYEITVICNERYRHTIIFNPFFKVDGKHVEFTGLGRAYCLQNQNGKWERAYFGFEKASIAALSLSRELDEPFKIFAAHNYDVGGTKRNSDGDWVVARYIGTAPNESRRGCELKELTDEYEDIAGFN